MFLRWLEVVVEFFEVVIGCCRWFSVVIRSFVRLIDRSFVRALARSFVRSFDR